MVHEAGAGSVLEKGRGQRWEGAMGKCPFTARALRAQQPLVWHVCET